MSKTKERELRDLADAQRGKIDDLKRRNGDLEQEVKRLSTPLAEMMAQHEEALARLQAAHALEISGLAAATDRLVTEHLELLRQNTDLRTRLAYHDRMRGRIFDMVTETPIDGMQVRLVSADRRTVVDPRMGDGACPTT